MKQWVISLSILFVLLIATIYVFIPGNLKISKHILIKATASGAYRYLAEGSYRVRWWPGRDSNINQPYPDSTDYFSYRGSNYKITQKQFNAVGVLIEHGVSKINSTIYIIPLGVDSIGVLWQYVIQTSVNPVKRVLEYQQARSIKNSIAEILYTLKSFLEKEQNIYNISIQQSTVKDTLLVTTKSVTKNYPTTSEIYSLIKRLKEFINKQAAKETNYPMLNVKTIDSSRFETMVAVPVNRRLPDSNNILFKRMVAGNILVTEIKGGRYTINMAFIELENYIKDYHIASPAIPFESLVTDRSLEKDSSKWVTRIYYPIY